MTTLSFYGAAGTVTGSCSMVDAAAGRFLVDCGMFQGNKTVRALNDGPFPFEPSAIDFLFLTHAHIDHSGLLPKLVKHGFRGPIYCTAPTADLLSVMLPDSAYIQKSNAERANRRRRRRGGNPVVPLYDAADVEETLKLIHSVDYGDWFEPASGFEARYWNAGHILGSASVEVKFAEPSTGNLMRLMFSGDIGPDEKVFHSEPDGEAGFDYIVCESTYGDRERDDYTLAERRAALHRELNQGLARGGNVVIPCFAVERSQELLHDIGVLLATNQLPNTTVFLDSPLAKRVTEVFIKYAHLLDDVELDESALFRDKRFRLIHEVEESKAINRIKGGAIIISASGMADAGRIKHHLRNNITNDKATVLFVGYQAPGTLGYYISNGAEDVRIHGETYKVRAAIRSIGNYSAHGDQGELVDWILERAPVAGGLFLNHGDDDARTELKRLLGKRGVDPAKIHLPQFDESFDIAAGSPHSKGRGEARIPDTQLLADWYNDYAAFIIALGKALEAESDPEVRRALIKKLEAVLEG